MFAPASMAHRYGCGDRFGNYLITGVPEAGACGGVFLARAMVAGVPVALKLGAAAGSAGLARGLAHPHIVAIHEVGQHDGLPFVAMEYVDAGTLQAKLAAGPPPLAQALAWMAQLLAALEHAHGRGVVHRDIKPANLLIDAAGCLKVADFGLAAPAQARTDGSGTPAYMAPEQMRGAPADARADLYAAAVVCYQLLTGTRPFDGSAFEIMGQVLKAAVPPASSRRPGLDARFDLVLDRALAREPADRYPSARALNAVLQATGARVAQTQM